MATGDFARMESAAECGCCVTGTEDGPEGFTCKDRSRGIFTPRESKVLLRIREAGERARSIKAGLREQRAEGVADAHGGEVVRELESLRELRGALEMERVAAATERMRFLGHE